MTNQKFLTQFLSLALMALLLAPAGFPRTLDDDQTEEEKMAALKANARELLRETSSIALGLGSPTNRINFTIQSADILWTLDETDARAMFNASTEDVKRMMAQLDAETNQRDQVRSTSWARDNSSGRLRNKSGQVFAMRSSLISSLANHDPDWAMRFLQETSGIFTNRRLASRVERDDKRLESVIIRKIAEKDVTKALELGREKLAKGVTSDVISLLSQIYRKDKEKGADFAEDVLSKLKSSEYRRNRTWMVVRLFQYGLGAIDADDTPLFTKSGLNSLGEVLAKYLTNSKSRYRTLSSNIMGGLEKYAPASAAQIKRTFEQRKAARSGRRGNNNGRGTGGGAGSENQLREARTKFQNEITADLNKLGNQDLSADDRKEIIETIKSKILAVSSDSYRLNGLLGLARRVAALGDKDTAAGILDEAEGYIDQNPKERQDFTASRSLADAYATVDADRSFVILENMIYRLNDVINGYVKYMEFSGNGRIVENEELLMNSRSRQFTNNLRLSPPALRSLAEKDFARLKDLTDKFERPEVRVEIRLQLAKALLNVARPVDSAGKTQKTVKKL